MQLTDKQEQILIGGMLGDMCIFKDKKSKYHRMNFAHSINQSEYFFFKYDILKDIFKTDPKIRFWIDKRTNKEYREIRAQSLTNEFFTELYLKWYTNGKRTINEDIYKMDWFGFAIWFMDDGYKSSSGGMYLSTDRYSDIDRRTLMRMIENNFLLKINDHSNKIYIPKKSADIVRKEIAKFTPKSMIYKLVY